MSATVHLLLTVVRLDDCNVSELVDLNVLSLGSGQFSGSPSSKLYLSFNVNGDPLNHPRVMLDSLPERMTFLGLLPQSGQRVTVELRSSQSTAVGEGILSGNNSFQDDGESLAKNSFLIDSIITKNSNRDQIFSLKLWDTQGKAIGTLQMIVEAVNMEQLALRADQRKRQNLSSLASRWGCFVNFVLLLLGVSFKLGLLTPRRTITAVGKLPIGKLALRRGISLAQGDFISSCVGVSEFRCSPVHLIMHQNGSLSLRTRASPHASPSPVDTSSSTSAAFVTDTINTAATFDSDVVTLWESGKLSRRPFQDFRATVTDAGELAILRGKKIVWRIDSVEWQNIRELRDNIEIL